MNARAKQVAQQLFAVVTALEALALVLCLLAIYIIDDGQTVPLRMIVKGLLIAFWFTVFIWWMARTSIFEESPPPNTSNPKP